MAQAKIYWDLENYAQAETIFYKSVEFCNENDTWRLHVAHVLFMQEKFKEAIAFYEPIVKKNYNNVNINKQLVLCNIFVHAQITKWFSDFIGERHCTGQPMCISYNDGTE